MLKMQLGMSGRFRLFTTNSNGDVRVDTGWFNNLITDNGLNLCATQSAANWESSGGMLNSISVGSGSSAPSVNDFTLENLISSINAGSTSTTVDSTDRYLSCLRTWQFGEGVAEGNISEIGVGVSSTDLFSRALVVDSGGNPTTITVLSDEFLNVMYELRVNQPIGDFNSTVNGYDVVLRSSNVNNTSAGVNWGSEKFGIAPAGVNGATIGTGSIQPITGSPASQVQANSTQTDSYTNGNFFATGSMFFNTSTANQESISGVVKFGPGRFQFSVDPAINKTSSDQLTIGFRLDWAREGELPS